METLQDYTNDIFTQTGRAFRERLIARLGKLPEPEGFAINRGDHYELTVVNWNGQETNHTAANLPGGFQAFDDEEACRQATEDAVRWKVSAPER